MTEKLKKRYFITALAMHREVYLEPDDDKFYELMERYEDLKVVPKRDSEWEKKAGKLNDDFQAYVKEVYARLQEMPEPPCGIEVYSIEELPDMPSVGWKHHCLEGLEFTQVPFDKLILRDAVPYQSGN